MAAAGGPTIYDHGVYAATITPRGKHGDVDFGAVFELIDFLCASAGGPMYYRGRDMALCHRGMRISESDWNVFLGHAGATLAKFQVPVAEQGEVVALVQSLKKDIVE